MANPFPSDLSLTSPKVQTTPPARPPFTLTLRNFSLKNALSYCSQILSRFSFDSSSPPSLESSSSTRESTTPSSPITPGGEHTSSAFPAALPFSPRAKRQRLQTEMRSLSDSQLGLQLAIILPESVRDSPSAVAESCPPQYCQRMRLRHSEGPGDAIPPLDLYAVQEEEDNAARIGGAQGAEAPASAASQEEVSGDDVDSVRLNGAGDVAMSSSSRSRRSRSSSELAEYARRFVSPRDLLFE